ncbi:MAG TPA: ABC transporter ATP-binding protein, partial [Clostridiaceae bacterium]|nr:ABC transporter ATP-binding protein [Clostridiaceae bacterium]
MQQTVTNPATVKNPVLEMIGITKSFGPVKANDNVNFTLQEGEIHALLGENGSGKSTLMNILAGIYNPDAGEIYLAGEKCRFTSPRQSLEKGIGMVHQHFKLIDHMSAWENIIIGTGSGVGLGKAEVVKKLKDLSKTYGIAFDPLKLVKDMSVGEKQNVEIMKVLYRGATILVMDEPTAVLTPQEIEGLFGVLRRMRDMGRSVIFISHKLNEVLDLCSQVTVLRSGRTVGTIATHEITPQTLVELMVGHQVDLSIERPRPLPRPVCMTVKNLTVRDEHDRLKLNHISFDMRPGEILGVAGLAGSGQKELCEAIAGLQPKATGHIEFDGKSLLGHTPREIIRMGISMSFIPEDRLGMGLVSNMDIVDNVMLKDYAFYKGPWLHRKEAEEKATAIVNQLEIRTPGVNQVVSRLSGGNIQKVILGREINLNPKLLITAYAVRGLDINSSHTIYDLLNEQKAKGVAILYIGEDLDVLIELCDRIMVLCQGEVTGIVNARKTNKEELGLMMAGTVELSEEEMRQKQIQQESSDDTPESPRTSDDCDTAEK